MNNKILSVVLVAGVAVTGFAGLSSANETGTGFFKGNSEIREIKEKIESGVEITETEQTLLDEARSKKGGNKFGKRKWLKNLSDEDKALLETMDDDEKKAFFDAKKAQMNAVKETHKAVVAKLIAGETLSDDEELARVEILERLSGDKAAKKPGTEVIKKLVNGETLSATEITQLAEMQAKHEEREAQKAIIEPIKAKLDAGEELSDVEQALLDEAKAEREENGKSKGKGKKGHGKGDREKRD